MRTQAQTNCKRRTAHENQASPRAQARARARAISVRLSIKAEQHRRRRNRDTCAKPGRHGVPAAPVDLALHRCSGNRPSSVPCPDCPAAKSWRDQISRTAASRGARACVLRTVGYALYYVLETMDGYAMAPGAIRARSGRPSASHGSRPVSPTRGRRMRYMEPAKHRLWKHMMRRRHALDVSSAPMGICVDNIQLDADPGPFGHVVP